MTTRNKWITSGIVTLACIRILGCFGRKSELDAEGGKPMNESRFTVEHIRFTSDKPFGEVTVAFEARLGKFNPEVYQRLRVGGDPEQVRARIDAMAGPSGFMLFATQDHGNLLRLLGQQRKAFSTSSATRCSSSK